MTTRRVSLAGLRPTPLALAVALPACLLGAQGAFAQDSELQELRDRIEQLESKLGTGTAPEPQAENNYLLKDGTGIRIGDTTVTIGGFIKADVLAGSNGNGWKNGYSVGLPRSLAAAARDGESDWKTGFSARESRISIGTNTSDVAGHDLKTYVEMDFNQGASADGNEVVSNSYAPRLRQAYGAWNNWLFGQTYTTFTDLAAMPEILDQGKQAAFIFLRQPMLRYTLAAPGGKLMLALENPEDGFGTESYDDQSYPDLVARYQIRNELGIYSVAGVVRSIEDDAADDTVTTGAVSLSARIPTVGRDDLRLQYSYGDLGRYMGLFTYPDVDRAALANGEVEPLKTFGATAAYRHFWSPNWRSSLSVSHTEIVDDLTGTTPPFGTLSYFDASTSVHVNLLWSPHKKLTLGVEYAHWNFAEIAGDGDEQYEQVMASAKLAF
ncbi:DcaP family trimeric outer membrane transporter [Marinobacter qingdaonensis]|uniref:DcaP family trimeric outer membrane transporter n=1 Tax=Marinobacter qingdaonensis TaxID=3108486 RepID=A0ABU5NW08_9GAMM|nr:DcaP family trimeric outer membrane transporter [Marinobacter sp. ASW11-75]MCS5564510.1 DcaP family trimeric outer membrane transporter [Oleiphilaceae bacterium]MEA1079990.1 DcaP family trimeric outer membrane transporter [Marinobacter sp. ASW11-75]MEE3116960.1 DcaP family trimeric outer membrane transporter [Pseudomonadota bacterium]